MQVPRTAHVADSTNITVPIITPAMHENTTAGQVVVLQFSLQESSFDTAACSGVY